MKERLKNLASRWKYGLVAVLALLGISSAVSYYAGFNHSLITQPKTVQTTPINEQVKGAQAPTITPIPTLTPTNTPVSTNKETNTVINSDPIIQCNFPHVGIKNLRKSICDMVYECELNGKWLIAPSRESCNDAQKNLGSKSQVQSVSWPTNAILPTYPPLPTYASALTPTSYLDNYQPPETPNLSYPKSDRDPYRYSDPCKPVGNAG
jgi:hypothetical protein